MSGVSAGIIEDTSALEAVAPEWWELWNRCPTALPFQSPAWLLPWWRAFAPGQLLTLAARREGRLVGLAPGYLEDGPLGRRILPLGISLSDHLDVLADPDCAEDALEGLSAAAHSRREAWDVWELENLLPEALALQLPLPPGCGDDVQDQEACPYLPVPEGTRDLTEILSVKKRRDIRLARNRCGRRGAVEIMRFSGAEASRAVEDVFQLHGARWRSRGEDGVLAPDRVQTFQREAAPELGRAGLLRIHLMRIGDHSVAFLYSLVHRGRSSCYLSGFDPDFAFESPGVLVMAEALQDAIGEGCREIDFLRGQERYKYQWGAIDRWNLKRSIRRVDRG